MMENWINPSQWIHTRLQYKNCSSAVLLQNLCFVVIKFAGYIDSSLKTKAEDAMLGYWFEALSNYYNYQTLEICQIRENVRLTYADRCVEDTTVSAVSLRIIIQ